VKGAINLQDGEKFETWLGSIIHPNEKFYLIAGTEENLDTTIKKAAKIGYEQNIKAATLPAPEKPKQKFADLDLIAFKEHPQNYTIVDVRNRNEIISSGKIFKQALSIPLAELRQHLDEIPADKPIVVHCAGGYRSAAASSIIEGKITNTQVYDLSEAINQFL
jgi:rhodanese-related sulfurtransferase